MKKDEMGMTCSIW